MAIAIDSRSEMSIAFDRMNGTSLGLVGPTVFAIGSDNRFIVVKQHPAKDLHASSFDRSVTNFFIIERSSSSNFADREKGVHGPMSEAEYAGFSVTNPLPRFTKVFPDLE